MGKERTIVLTRGDVTLAARMAGRGMSNDQIAHFFEISPRTFDRMLERDEVLNGAIKRGRAEAADKMMGSLYERGIRGSETAAIFWLKTQCRWREADRDNSAGGVKPKSSVQLNYSLDEDEDGASEGTEVAADKSQESEADD